MTVDSESIRQALFTRPRGGSYQFAGAGPSLVADAAAAAGWDVPGVDKYEAVGRLHKFAQETAYFATIDSTSAADLVPPGYKTVTELVASADRPLANAANRAPIDGPNPFVIPDVSGTDTVADHTEGDPAHEGTLVTDSGPVEPAGISGKLPLTRELVDSASPSGDLIALAAMREDYARQVEEKIYAALNTAQSGTITAGFVPSGAQVTTSTGTALTADLKRALARYASVRGRKPRNAVVSGLAAEELADPPNGLDETTGDAGALWRPMGVGTNASVVDFGTGADDADVVILSSNDLWLFESPILQFRYGQRQGPEIVEAVLWAYVAVRLVRPRGLSVIRWT